MNPDEPAAVLDEFGERLDLLVVELVALRVKQHAIEPPPASFATAEASSVWVTSMSYGDAAIKIFAPGRVIMPRAPVINRTR